jgi:AcrR family transcriptional regulator
MAKIKKKTPTRRSHSRQTLKRGDWLQAARAALIEEGTAGIEINKLAKRLGATSRSGFYWFFKDRAQLLGELLNYWVETSTGQYESILKGNGQHGMREYLAITNMWIDEKEYDPRWDGAVRDWARTSDVVRKAVRGVDAARIGFLEQMFIHMGYRGKQAHIRARVMYYHQVGYYALGVQESHRARLALIPFYRDVLTGLDT